MADNQMNDGTSFQQAEMPILCAKGCGFFGTAATSNMCSKCYRDHLREENQAETAKAAVEKSLMPPSPAPVTLVVSDKGKSKSVESSSVVAVAEEEMKAEAVAEAAVAAKPKNRCGSCNKKVGVLGFECKCGSTFCGAHRYPEEHQCTFDFMDAGKKLIAKANPVVKADKVERF